MISFNFPISRPATNNSFIKNFNPSVVLKYSDKTSITKSGNLVSSWANRGSFPANATFSGTSSNSPIDDGTGIKFGTDRTTNLVIPGLFNGGTHTDCTIIIVSKPNNISTAPFFSVTSAAGTNFWTEKTTNWRHNNTISTSTFDKWTAFDSGRLGNIGKDNTYSKQSAVHTIRFASGKRTYGVDYRIINRDEQNTSRNGPGIQNLSGDFVIGSQNPNDYKAQETITDALVFPSFLSNKEMLSIIKNLELSNKLEIKGLKDYQNCNIQAVGDSLTLGVGTNIGSGSCLSYPNQLVEMLGSGILEYSAAGGTSISEILSICNSVAVPRYSTSFDKNIAMIMAGTNNFIKTSQTAAQAFAELQTLHQTLKAVNYKTAAFTIPPANTVPGSPIPADFESRRVIYNNLIAANWTSFSDAFVDLRVDDDLNLSSSTSNTIYRDPDNLHFTDLGYKKIATLALPKAIYLLSL